MDGGVGVTRESLEQIERAKRQWESTVDSLPQLVCLLDDRGRIVRANRTVQAWGLCDVVEVRGRLVHALLHPVCSDPDCPQAAFWRSAWARLAEGQPAECEYMDSALHRYLSVRALPFLARPSAGDEERTPFAVAIIDDITDRRQAEEALRSRTAELQARNEELDAFARTVAHDLKDPLNLIAGFASVLQQCHAEMSEEELQRTTQVIVDSGLRMSTLIDELLLLAGVRAMDVQTTSLDMANIVGEAMQRLAHLIDQAEAEVIVPETWPAAIGYAPWVEEVWVNYLSNAIKYGGRPPRVELGAVLQEDVVRFWARDNGFGLTEEEQDHLFRVFTRLAPVRAAGSGLGLTIVLRIVEKLGGQVGVESQVGQGSVFSFTLLAAKG